MYEYPQKIIIIFDFNNIIHPEYKECTNSEIHNKINYHLPEYIFDILIHKYYICIFFEKNLSKLLIT